MITNLIRGVYGSHVRSILLSLSPLGLDTLLVEGLPSYLSRLSVAHSLFPGALLAKYIVPVMGNPNLTDSLDRGSSRLYERSGNFLGHSDLTLRIVTAFEDLTLRNDLLFLTLLPFRGIFDEKGLLKDFRAWCPQCFESWGKSKEGIYEPLIWALKMILFCPVHGSRLLTICPTCKHTQPVVARKMLVGHCFSCGSWLGGNKSEESIPRLANYESWVVRNIAQLFSNVRTLSFMPFKGLFTENLSRYINDYFKGNVSSFAVHFGIPRATAKRWRSGVSFPTLDHLLRLCYLSNTPLLDLMLTGSLRNGVRKRTLPGSASQISTLSSRRKTVDTRPVQEFLQAVLDEKALRPLSLKEVSKQLGYTKRTLYLHFPDLCKAIAAKNLDYSRRQKRERVHQLSLFVQNITRQLHFADIYPSYDRVEAAAAPKKGILREKEMKNVWRETMKQLDLWPGGGGLTC